MTLEEKAKKLASSVPLRKDIPFQDYIRTQLASMYYTGAVENGIIWHDLRKNPDDLPKGKINRYLFGYVKNYSGKKPMIIAYNGEWFYDVNTYNTEVKVIVWCEIPVYPF